MDRIVRVPAEQDEVIVYVTGRRPEDQPYIWIGTDAGGMFATIHEDDMLTLRDAIDRALG